jgi:hypothetical protein
MDRRSPESAAESPVRVTVNEEGFDVTAQPDHPAHWVAEQAPEELQAVLTAFLAPHCN